MFLRKPKSGEKNNCTDLNKRNKKSKYSIGSLLLLLAFFFYFVFVKNGSLPDLESKPKTEKEAPLSQFTGKVVSVSDGDTFKVLYNGKKVKVRLLDIDCPETKQIFGSDAKDFANNLCYGKMVTVDPIGGKDQYGRILGYVYVDDTINVNALLVKKGLAWRYKYSDNEEFKELENQARIQYKGLWAQKDPIAPWEWRKLHNRK